MPVTACASNATMLSMVAWLTPLNMLYHGSLNVVNSFSDRRLDYWCRAAAGKQLCNYNWLAIEPLTKPVFTLFCEERDCFKSKTSSP